MADPKGFMKFQRETPRCRPVDQRTKDWNEFYEHFPEERLKVQGARCMDCGVPFCQSKATGCPVENVIPEWNDLVHRAQWKQALKVLHATNNFPEFTGKLCPAPCETACVLGINSDPVTIRVIESSIIDRGFDEGWVQPVYALEKTDKRVAVIGSGPAGLAAAQQLARAGHGITIFEKSDRVGGLLRYGIPDFKMEKWVLDRRIDQMHAEGVEFKTNVNVGVDLEINELMRDYHAVCLATGADRPRELEVVGRDLKGVHLAMDYLTQQNRKNAGDTFPEQEWIDAKGKRVVIIGGGDTGSDCLGTAHRQGCVAASQLELLPEPPLSRSQATPWPMWPMQLRVSHAHEEGCKREWGVSTTHLSGINGHVKKLHAQRIQFEGGRISPIPGTDFEIEVDLVLLAMGFVGPQTDGLLDALGVNYDSSGNVSVDHNYRTSIEKVYACGDVKRGASLIVWAISEGRKMAAAVDAQLRGYRL